MHISLPYMTLDPQHAARTARWLGQAVSSAGFDRDLTKRLATVRSFVPGRIVFTTSFGLEDQAITHAIFRQGFGIDVVTLDTGRLFGETYEVWAQTERQYGRLIPAYFPDRLSLESMVASQGIHGFYNSVEARHECCAIRKVEPLQRALAGAAAWVTGLRADQSDERVGICFALVDSHHQLIKINPLFDWTREQVLSFVRERGIPYNSLHDQGFASIGCAPCTRAIAPGEPERAGRWWWEHEQKKECGLHCRHQSRTSALPQFENSLEESTR
jgi:phosphoadenosine phosphosulfate reductase